MPTWDAPLDWVTDQRLRARDLNHELNDNVGWLKDRPYHIRAITPTGANLANANTAWTVLTSDYQLELVLPDVCNVLLFANLSIIGIGSTHAVGFTWVRDGNFWLNSTAGTKPSAVTDGIGTLMAHTTVYDATPILWWDTQVPAGRHTWDLAFMNASNSFELQQNNNAWQIGALAW